MLDEQSDDEHDNDIGDATDQEDDKISSSEDTKKTNKKKTGKIDLTSENKNEVALSDNSKQSDHEKKPKKAKNEEVGPLDHVIEFILGDRFPTQKEYSAWLQSEEYRIDQPDKLQEYNPQKQEFLLVENQKSNQSSEQSTTVEQKSGESLINKKPEQIQYLVKFKNLCYRRCRWINESDFENVYSYQCLQKLNRYKIKKKKDPKQIEDEYFDRSYLEIDKIICSTNLFPVIHPRQAKNISGTWRE